MRVFIASDTPWARHEPVLEYSIHRHTKGAEVTFLRPDEIMGRTGCTGFTNMRYAIPEICDQDHAIYLDVDMLVLSDLNELWEYRRDGWAVLEDGSDEVAVVDCRVPIMPIDELAKRKKWEIHIEKHPVIPLAWNCQDPEVISPDTKLIHFTDLHRQPWFTDRDDAGTRMLETYERHMQQGQV